MYRRERWGSILSHQARPVERLLGPGARQRRRDHVECKHHQGGSDRGPDRPALVRRHRQCKRRPHGDRRHQRQGRPSGTPARALSRGQRDRRRRRGREGREARAGGRGRRHPRRHLQLHTPGDQGPGRRGGEDALHLPRAVRGPGVRPAHLLHRSRARAAGRSADPVADGEDGREEVLPTLGRLHLAARPERARHGGRHGERRRDRRRGVLPARPHGLRRDRRAHHGKRRRRRLQHDRAARA